MVLCFFQELSLYITVKSSFLISDNLLWVEQPNGHCFNLNFRREKKYLLEGCWHRLLNQALGIPGSHPMTCDTSLVWPQDSSTLTIFVPLSLKQIICCRLAWAMSLSLHSGNLSTLMGSSTKSIWMEKGQFPKWGISECCYQKDGGRGGGNSGWKPLHWVYHRWGCSQGEASCLRSQLLVRNSGLLYPITPLRFTLIRVNPVSQSW